MLRQDVTDEDGQGLRRVPGLSRGRLVVNPTFTLDQFAGHGGHIPIGANEAMFHGLHHLQQMADRMALHLGKPVTVRAKESGDRVLFQVQVGGATPLDQWRTRMAVVDRLHFALAALDQAFGPKFVTREEV